MESPQDMHWTAVKRILRYLQGTKTHGIRFDLSGGLVGYFDVDWAGDVADRKSTSGYVLKLVRGRATANRLTFQLAISGSSSNHPSSALLTFIMGQGKLQTSYHAWLQYSVCHQRTFVNLRMSQ